MAMRIWDIVRDWNAASPRLYSVLCCATSYPLGDTLFRGHIARSYSYKVFDNGILIRTSCDEAVLYLSRSAAVPQRKASCS